MKLDLPALCFDAETISAVELKEVGARNYLAHPSARMLCVVGQWLDQEVQHKVPMWGQKLAPSPCPFALPERFIAIAHNARTFDRHVWRLLGWPEPVEWWDTAEWARMAGFPRASLGSLGVELGFQKDYKGSDLVLRLQQQYRENRERAQHQLAFPGCEPDAFQFKAADKQQMLGYCSSDVDGLAKIARVLYPWEQVDRPGRLADQAVQDRGICFDRQLATALLRTDARLAAAACKRARTWPELIRSREVFLATLSALGVDVPNAQRKTLQKALKDLDSDEPAAELIKARLAGTTIAAGKLRAALARQCPDGKQRDTTMIYAAHTWRWAGKGIQVQNLTGGDPIPGVLAYMALHGLKEAEDVPQDVIDTETEILRDRLVAGEEIDLTAGQINTMLRACFMASPGNKLHVADFAGIENRVLAWAAGDEKALENQRAGKDVYIVLAAIIFGVDESAIPKKGLQRKAGKIGELGLGYQMGKKKFRNHLLANGIDPAVLLRDFGVDSDAVVDGWRQLHAPIVQLWQDAQDAATQVTRTRGACGPIKVGPVTYKWKTSRWGGQLVCLLPSGRPIMYQRAAIVRWFRDGNWFKARMPDGTWVSFEVDHDDGRTDHDGLVFRGRKGWTPLYGGLLVENFVQAISRDLLAHALHLCETEGLNPVMHVHDSIVTDNNLPDGQQRLTTIMSAVRAAAYALGIPIKSAAFTALRYA